MIHPDLMLVVIEVLIMLDLEPPGPLPGVLLTGFAEHTAHGDWPLLGSHVVPQALSVHNGSQYASKCTMGHNVSVSRSESRLNSGRSVQSRPGPGCAADTCDAQSGRAPSSLIISLMQLMLS